MPQEAEEEALCDDYHPSKQNRHHLRQVPYHNEVYWTVLDMTSPQGKKGFPEEQVVAQEVAQEVAEEPQWSVLVMTLPRERKGFPEEQVVAQEVAEEPQWSVLVMTLPRERKGFPEEQVVAQEVAQEVAEEPQWSVLDMTSPRERKGFPEEQVVAQEVAQEVAEEPQWSVLVMTLPRERKGFPEEQVVAQEVAQELAQEVAEEPQWSVLVMTLPQERKGFPEEQVVAQEVAQEVAEEPQWSVLVMTLPRERKGFPEEQGGSPRGSPRGGRGATMVSPGHDVTPREEGFPRRTGGSPRGSPRGGRGAILDSPGHDVTPREEGFPRRTSGSPRGSPRVSPRGGRGATMVSPGHDVTPREEGFLRRTSGSPSGSRGATMVSPGHDVTPREVKIPRRTRSGPRDSTRGGRGGISSSPGHDVTPREVRRPRREILRSISPQRRPFTGIAADTHRMFGSPGKCCKRCIVPIGPTSAYSYDCPCEHCQETRFSPLRGQSPPRAPKSPSPPRRSQSSHATGGRRRSPVRRLSPVKALSPRPVKAKSPPPPTRPLPQRQSSGAVPYEDWPVDDEPEPELRPHLRPEIIATRRARAEAAARQQEPPIVPRSMTPGWTETVEQDMNRLAELGFIIDRSPNGLLGTGDFGRVYRGWYDPMLWGRAGILPFDRFAAKLIDQRPKVGRSGPDPHNLRGLKYIQTIEGSQTEKLMVSLIKHPNVIDVKYIFQFGEPRIHNFQNEPKSTLVGFDRTYIIMELAEGGRLEDWIQSHRIPVWRLLSIVRDIARGIRYLHSIGIAHNDIYMINILMFRRGQDWVTKLADFGLAYKRDRSLPENAGPSGKQSRNIEESTSNQWGWTCATAHDFHQLANIIEEIMDSPNFEPPKNELEKRILKVLTDLVKAKKDYEISTIEEVFQRYPELFEEDEPVD